MDFRQGAGIVILFLSPIATAAQLTADVVDSHGKPIADAVITVVPQSNTELAENLRKSPSAATKTIDQKNETFIPYVEIFRPGDAVVFHNSDHTRHHAYSFAPARQFEFVLTSGQSSAPLPIEQTGVIAVGCNIHDQMIAYLYVSNAPYVARTDADGHAVIDALPPGDFDVQVWHPQLRPGQPPAVQVLHVSAGDVTRNLSFPLSLLPDPRSPLDRERAKY